MKSWKEIWKESKLTQKQLAEKLQIPKRTIEDWITGKRTPPEYVTRAAEIALESFEQEKGIEIPEKEENATQSKRKGLHNISPRNHDLQKRLWSDEDWTLNDELINIQAMLIDAMRKKTIEEMKEEIKQIEKILNELTE